MNLQDEYDVVVVGGGPAGSTVASLLAQWGRRVLVLEKECFPRHHIGESLLPGTVRVMKKLGVLDKVERAGFVPKFGASYIWGKSRNPWTIYFSEVAEDSAHSFQVERATFDKILLDHSRESGATVVEQSCATGFIQDRGRIVGVEYLDQSQISRVANCKLCVDASGQSSVLASRLHLREFNPGLRNIALYAYFQGGKTVVELLPNLSSRDAGNIFIIATDIGWIWYIPLGARRFSVGLVTAASFSRRINKLGRSNFYLKTLTATPELAFLLKDARMESGPVSIISDWSYVSRSFQGPGYLLVGDAACFVDPILSTGVDLAMVGALKAAFAINTALSTTELSDRAMDWYEEEYRNSANNYLEMAAHWYHGQRSQRSWFWKARRLVDPASNMSIRQAFILLSGGYENYLTNTNSAKQAYFGGFTASQLKTIYSSLDNGISRGITTSSPAPRTSHNAEVGIQEESCPCFGEDVRYRPYMSYMLARDSKLLPVVQVLRDSGKLPQLRVVLSCAALPVLDRINGKKSVRAISEEVADLSGNKETRNKVRDAVLLLLQQLSDAHLIREA